MQPIQPTEAQAAVDPLWLDVPAAATAAKPGQTRTVVAAVIGAVVIGAAAIVGINVLRSPTGGTTTNAAQGGFAGGPAPNGRPGGAGPGRGFGGPPGAAGGTVGTVDRIDGSTMTLTGRNGRITVVTSAATVVTTATGETASLADIAVGDFISVMGPTNANGSVTATAVMVGLPSGPGGIPPPGAARP